MKSLRSWVVVLAALAVPACSCATPDPTDAGRDAFLPLDAALDAPDTTVVDDAGTDAPAEGDGGTDAPVTSCIEEGHEAGERYPAGDPWDGCNFCDCLFDGSTICTDRTCSDSDNGCTYDGTEHGYGERFPSADGCNECVCAASGLACTVRDGCTDVPESAILLESMNDPCGDDPSFTPTAALGTLPTDDFVAPFLYERDRESYPEVLPDTNVRVRIVFEEGFFMVCRLPSPDQPALDLQVTLEWITSDGAFDEGLPAYLRRNGFGFLDEWQVVTSAPLGGLHGTYAPICPILPRGYTFDVHVEPDGHAFGGATRVCEGDLSLPIGTFDRPAP